MSLRFFATAAMAALLLSLPVRAANDVSMAGFHLKNRSAFKVSSTRPPFWPIGWVHQAKGAVAQVEQPKVTLDAKMFLVTSILGGVPPFAVINSRSYTVGDYIRVARIKSADGAAPPPPSARIRVQKISDGSVTLASDTQSIVVPLRRPELTDHKGDKEEDQLSDQR